MHFVLVAVGTRGDAQPFVALGAALARRGHRVTIATHEDHRALVEGAGLALRPICESMRVLLDTPEGRRWVESGDNVFAYGKAFRALYAPHIDRWWRDQIGAVEDADVVVGHWFAAGAALGAEKRNLRLILLCPYPSIATGQISMASIGNLPLIGPWINRTGWGVFERIAWAPCVETCRALRAELGLPSSTARNGWVELRARETPHLHCFSELVLPRPSDWPSYAEVTGWCTLNAAPAWRPSAELERFLDGGDALYVGFGSMTGMDPAVLARTTLAALRRAKQRAVIGAGWGSLDSIERGDDVMYVDDVPHDWLFRRVRAVVHHGGAGTLAAGLRAGKPTLVVPFFGDQPLWGRRAHILGVGPAPVSKKALNEVRLGDAIAELCSEPSYAARADELCKKLGAEDGTELTANRVIQLLKAA